MPAFCLIPLGGLAILMAGMGATPVTGQARSCGMGTVTRPTLVAEPFC
jgi:hypothetical protein